MSFKEEVAMSMFHKIDRALNATKADPKYAPDKIELEKNDMLALLIAGFFTMLPALLIVILLVLGVMWFFMWWLNDLKLKYSTMCIVYDKITIANFAIVILF